MQHSTDMHAAPPESRWPASLSGTVERCTGRASRSPVRLRRASRAEARQLLSSAREGLKLACDESVWRMQAKNPEILQAILDGHGAPVGLFACLPLNRFGASLLVQGGLDGAQPDPAWLCRAGEQPEAVYLWLVFAPRRWAAALPSACDLVRSWAPRPVPIFSRAATAISARLHMKAGFLEAGALYPNAPDWLLVALPAHAALARRGRGDPGQGAGRLEVSIVRTMEGLARIFALRAATFIAEQFCTYQEEFDGNDLCSTQFLGTVNGDAAGCIRLRYFGDFAKLERLCVRREYRGSGLKDALVQAALAHASAKGFRLVYGHARADLVDMWRGYGFEPIQGRRPFRFANIDYVEIIHELAPDENAVRLGVPAMMTTRPEGAWDEPGPLDLSIVDVDPERVALLERFTRFRGERHVARN